MRLAGLVVISFWCGCLLNSGGQNDRETNGHEVLNALMQQDTLEGEIYTLIFFDTREPLEYESIAILYDRNDSLLGQTYLFVDDSKGQKAVEGLYPYYVIFDCSNNVEVPIIIIEEGVVMLSPDEMEMTLPTIMDTRSI